LKLTNNLKAQNKTSTQFGCLFFMSDTGVAFKGEGLKIIKFLHQLSVRGNPIKNEGKNTVFS